ncbi:MAG: MFS transporter [Acidobacteriota bacterium]
MGQSGPIRYRILALLVGLSLVSYLLRSNISIAAKFMMPELGLDEVRMGQVFSAFMLGYALFQIPAGAWGDRRGPRLVLAVAALCWGVATLLTGLVPAFAALTVLLVVRFLLGAAEAATYPVAARAVADWFPVGERTFASVVVVAGSTFGMIFNGPLISTLMVAQGWRVAFLLTSLTGLLIALLWWRLATDHPADHPAISAAELALIGADRPDATRPLSWRKLLADRNLGLVSISYFLDSYVLFIFIFWFYLYLTDERGFSILKGGYYNSLPFVAAMVLMPLTGWLCDRLGRRTGRSRARRAFAFGLLALAAVALFLGARAAEPTPAILCLSLAVGLLMSSEGPFWSTVSESAWPHSGAAGGVMNTAGNLAGVVSTAVTPLMVRSIGWTGTFIASAAMLLTAGLLWFFIRTERSPSTGPDPA